MTHEQIIQEATKIASEIKGKNVLTRRLVALQNAGFTVEYAGTKYNFGCACTAKDIKGEILMQLKYATSGKSRKTGYSVNHCEVYKISKS